MEYSLILEQKKRFGILVGLLIFAIISVAASFLFLGIKGIILALGFIFVLALTPLFINNYSFFIFLWLFLGIILEPNYFALMGINLPIATILLITFPSAFIIIFMEAKNVIKELPFVKYLLIFQFLILINIFRVEVPLYNFFNMFRIQFIGIFMIFATYLYVKQGKPINKIINWLNILAILNALTAVFQGITHQGLMILEGIPRVRGFTTHPSLCATIINIYFILAVNMLMNAKTKMQKIIWSAGIIINFLAFILTFSKTAFAMFIMNCLIMLFVFPNKIKIRLLSITVLVSVVLIIVNACFDLKIFDYLFSRMLNNDSFTWRLKMWNYLLANINFVTLLIGNGLDSAFFYLSKITSPYDSHLVHNGYLQLIYEYGIFGLSYVIAFYLIVKNAMTKFFSCKNFARKLYILGLLILPLDLLIQMVFTNTLNTKSYIYFFWIVMTIFYLKINSPEENDKVLKTNDKIH